MNDVIDFDTARMKREMAKDIIDGRTPLYVSHRTGMITGQPNGKVEDFGTRLARIKTSLERINALMRELKDSGVP